MGSIYKYGVNPFMDFLFESIKYDIDISNKMFNNDMRESFKVILQNVLDDQIIDLYLDFEIKKKNNHFKVIGKNAITALWLSGIFVQNVDTVLRNNVFIIENRQYRYNEKTYKLSYKIIDE